MSIDNDWPVPQRPMGIGAIYLSTLRLAGRTALRCLPVAFLLIVPVYLLLGSAMRALLLDASRIIAENGSDISQLSPQAAGDLAGSFAFAGVASLVLLVAITVAQLATTIDAWDHAVGVTRPFGDWLRRVFGRPMAMTLAQIVILTLLLTTIVLAYMLLATLLVAVGDAGTSIATFLVLFAILYVAIATVFRIHEIVADDRGPWRSLLSSIALTRGNWFRVIATLLPPLSILLVASELLSPATADIDLEEVESIAIGYRAMADAFTTGRSLALGAIAAVMQFLVVNLLTALYVDLRARRGDFDYDEAEEIAAAEE